ncbi:Phosphoglycerate mutase [Oxalobacteraceae bacterium IMCC9480]|nr:Phosphoglycerate mutase [Oxalobacteraceae bacterium IMCC9480]
MLNSPFVVRCTLALLALTTLLPLARADDAAIWTALQGGGQVVLLRHSSTESGIGDPPGFTLADCRSQRQLSADGRAQAQRLGEAFRSRSIPVAQVWSSRWCRCVDTARLAFGRVTPMAMLDSGFEDSADAFGLKLRAVSAAIRDRTGDGNVVMVTHQVNITELTGIVPRMGEMVVLTGQVGADGKFAVRGRVQVD